MIQIDCCTFACPKCPQLSIDRKRGLKALAKLNAKIGGGGLWEFLGVKPLVDVWWLDGLPYSQVRSYLDEADTWLFGGV